MNAAVGAVGGILPSKLQCALVAAVTDRVAGAVAEVRRVADHQALGVLPERLHLVRRGERVLVLPRVDTAEAYTTLGDAEAGDEVCRVEEVHGPLGHGALRELPVPIPGRVQNRIEGLRRAPLCERLPVEVLCPDVGLEVFVPVGPFAVADLLDARESAEFARLHQFTATHRDGRAAQLRADLDDDARGLRGRVRPVQLADVDRHGLFDIHVLARARGRLEVGGVPVIGRGDEHRVHIGEAEQFVHAPALRRVGSEPLLRLRRRILPGHPPGVVDRDHFQVLCLRVITHAGHLGADAAVAAPDDADPNAVVGADTAPDGPRVDASRRHERDRSRRCDRCQELPA